MYCEEMSEAGRGYARAATYPCTSDGSHQIRVGEHSTIWFEGTMLNEKSGSTCADALKQLASLLLCTVAATLVPPEPKPELSLTCGCICERLILEMWSSVSAEASQSFIRTE